MISYELSDTPHFKRHRSLPHHKLIFEIVKKNPGIHSGSFYEVYRQEAREIRLLNPKSLRTFSNYVNRLVELEYLNFERAKSKGNVEAFKTT